MEKRNAGLAVAELFGYFYRLFQNKHNMKILGLSCGRKMGNTEILIKEALMGAESLGAEVELIRLNDLNIKPCTGCNACVVNLLQKNGSGDCVLKNDDYHFMDEKLMECDGLILGSPIYEKGATGLLKTLNDRFGPSHDVAMRTIARNMRKEKGITTGKGPDERTFKKRAASLIAVGGSEWDTLALPMLYLVTLPFQMHVVDQILVNWTGLPRNVVFNEDALKRAAESGKHVAASLLDDKEEFRYIGEPGICPLCHSKLIEIRNGDDNNPAVCSICGVKGTLNVMDGKVKFELPEGAKEHSHIYLSGKFEHVQEIKEVALKKNPLAAELPKRSKKYENYLQYSRPEQ